MKRIFLVSFSMMIIFTSLFSFAFAREFSDVASTHWAFNYISELSDKNIINGYEDGTFKPSGTITRAEFIKLVVSTGLGEDIDMDEAEGTLKHWASNYVWLAENYGIIEGGSINLNNINEPISRIEMCRMIANADMIFMEHDAEFQKSTTFTDIIDLSTNDVYLLRHCVSRGLVTGYEDGTFRPNNTMTRAEAATMIYRLSKV